MEVLPVTTVRMLLDGISALLMLALILAMFRKTVGDQADTHKRKQLLAGMWLHVLWSTTDGVVAALQARVGPDMGLLVGIGTIAAYLFEVATGVMGTIYVYGDTTGRPLRDERTRPIVIMLLLLNMLQICLVLSNRWTHIFYADARVTRIAVGALSRGGVMLVAFQTIVSLVGVLLLCGRLSVETARRLVACEAFFILGMYADLRYPSLPLLNPAGCMMYALLAVGVQSKLEEELAQARAETAESRVRLLSGQIHPHFVFNSLAAIKALLIEDPDRAELALQDFSDYLRSHLDELSTTRLVPFRTEIGHVRHYVSLEMADLTVPLFVGYEFEVEDFLVPPLTIQPLVENAIRHGLRTREGGGHVVVASRCKGDDIIVTVSDDGHGISSATHRQEQRQRVGIENVRERIERQCGGRLDVVSSDTGTVATMIIPRGVRP